MTLIPKAALSIAILIGLLLLAGQAGWLAGRRPEDLGVRDGRLKPPSRTPNSVSSQAHLYPEHRQRDYAAMAAWPVRGDATQAMQTLARRLAEQPRTQVITVEPDYVRAECRTRWLGFTDDLEFWLDRQRGEIHFRSASRLGRKDFGVNRARMERLQPLLTSP